MAHLSFPAVAANFTSNERLAATSVPCVVSLLVVDHAIEHAGQEVQDAKLRQPVAQHHQESNASTTAQEKMVLQKWGPFRSPH